MCGCRVGLFGVTQCREGVELLAGGENRPKRRCEVEKVRGAVKRLFALENRGEGSQLFTNALWKRNPLGDVERRRGKLWSHVEAPKMESRGNGVSCLLSFTHLSQTNVTFFTNSLCAGDAETEKTISLLLFKKRFISFFLSF